MPGSSAGAERQQAWLLSLVRSVVLPILMLGVHQLYIESVACSNVLRVLLSFRHPWAHFAPHSDGIRCVTTVASEKDWKCTDV